MRRVFLLLLLAACHGGDDPLFPARTGPIVRGPQLGLAAPDGMLVAWNSSAPVIGTLVVDGRRFSDASPSTEHAFQIAGLLPDTAYDYVLEHDGAVVSSGHAFRTAPAPGGPVRFVVIGDSGSSTANQRAVATGIAASAPDLVLITGDVVYESGRENELDPSYFLPYRALLETVPFYPALGNHDVLTDDARPLLDAVHLPGNERHYSFDRGGVHFVALDSNRELAPGSVQGDWLAADLAAATARWIVVYLHHPPYSSSRHGSDLGVRAALAPLCDAHGVDVVFAGHDHVYERTQPMFNDVVVDARADGAYADPAGTVYVVTGGGGKTLYTAGTSAFTAVSSARYHHVEVHVDGDTFSFRAIATDGTVLDTVTITKTP